MAKARTKTNGTQFKAQPLTINAFMSDLARVDIKHEQIAQNKVVMYTPDPLLFAGCDGVLYSVGNTTITFRFSLANREYQLFDNQIDIFYPILLKNVGIGAVADIDLARLMWALNQSNQNSRLTGTFIRYPINDEFDEFTPAIAVRLQVQNIYNKPKDLVVYAATAGWGLFNQFINDRVVVAYNNSDDYAEFVKGMLGSVDIKVAPAPATKPPTTL